MQSTVHINVSAIDYDATSRAIATVLDRMQDRLHQVQDADRRIDVYPYDQGLYYGDNTFSGCNFS